MGSRSSVSPVLTEIVAREQQTYFRSFLRKITSAISSCETISVTSIILHQSEFGSSVCGAWALRGDLDVREKNKMAEDGESSLDHAFAKVCDIFGFEKLNKHQEEAIQQIVEMRSDVYVNLPTGYGKSVVFQALPTVFAPVDRYEKNIVIVISPLINLMKDQVHRLSLLGVSATSLSDISSAAEIKKGGEWRIFYRLRIA